MGRSISICQLDIVVDIDKKYQVEHIAVCCQNVFLFSKYSNASVAISTAQSDRSDSGNVVMVMVHW